MVTSLALAGCGGSKSYREGTPAATGQAPDCSILPLDLVTEALELELSGPVADSKNNGVVCKFSHPRAGVAVERVELNSNADKESFALVPDALKQADNPVKKIKGWGDEAYASTVHFFNPINNFAVRKGKVSVLITSSTDYEHIQKLMKEILAKL